MLNSLLVHIFPTRRLIVSCLVVVTFMLGGCTSVREYVSNGFKVGPKYHRSPAPVANEWIDAYNPKIVSAPIELSAWWTVFNDPVLDHLVVTAYQQNLPLRVAGLRVLEARAQRGIAAGNVFPQFQEAFGEYSRIQLSENSPLALPNAPRALDLFSSGFDAAWELDIWGRFRCAVEAADADLQASFDNYDDVLVILIADVAATYVEIREFETRLRLARQNVDIQEGSLRIVNAQFPEVTSELDVQQARANLARTLALIPAFETGRRQAQNRLCILLGMPPHELTSFLGGVGPIPTTPSEVVLGIPADLLRRRPDVRRAEREVAAQSARIGIATSELYPRLTITGSIKVEAEDFSELFTSASTAGVISPGIRWNILNYGRLLNNIRVNDARFEQLAVTYQNTVLRANQEAEDAIVAYLQSQELVKHLSTSTKAAERSVQLARIQFREGTIDFGRVFVLERLLVEEQDRLADAQSQVAINLIRLHKALGGGWQLRSDFSEIRHCHNEEIAVPNSPQADEIHSHEQSDR